jgi:hypothetical protein
LVIQSFKEKTCTISARHVLIASKGACFSQLGNGSIFIENTYFSANKKRTFSQQKKKINLSAKKEFQQQDNVLEV